MHPHVHVYHQWDDHQSHLSLLQLLPCILKHGVCFVYSGVILRIPSVCYTCCTVYWCLVWVFKHHVSKHGMLITSGMSIRDTSGLLHLLYYVIIPDVLFQTHPSTQPLRYIGVCCLRAGRSRQECSPTTTRTPSRSSTKGMSQNCSLELNWLRVDLDIPLTLR